MDPLAALAPLKNRYLCVRHGESEANVAGFVSSDPAISTLEHGLTPTGFAQARVAASAVRLLADGAPIACVASDFLRTRHTAETMAVALVTFDVRLRERYFGDFNGQSHEAYKIVWAHDAEDGGLQHSCDNVESVASVVARVTALIAHLESTLAAGTCVALVSHGDTLQMLQAAFAGVAPNLHRSLPHLKNCEVRPLELIRDRACEKQ